LLIALLATAWAETPVRSTDSSVFMAPEVHVTAVIYSHRHPDHAFGAAGWGVTEDMVSSGAVQVFASENFVRNLINDTGVVGPILTQRTAYASIYVPMGPEGSVQYGIGPSFTAGEVSLFLPTQTVSSGAPLKVEVSGVQLELFHAYGDAGDDEIDLYLPELRHVHGSETIQGESFPNLYTLRGTGYRDVVQWYKGVDQLLAYAQDANSYSGSHMRAWTGNGFIVERIQNYRDAIAYMYHQTVRLINRGLGPEAIASQLQLPAHLATSPVLGQWYNDFQTNIRGIYSYLVGHYSDVAEMPLLDPAVDDRNMIALAGGADAYLQRLREAHGRGDHVWVARASTHLIRQQPGNQAVRDLKASSLRVLAAQTISGSQRHFYLQHAAALEGLIDLPVRARFRADDVATVPVGSLLQQLPFRLDAAAAAAVTAQLSLHITDLDEHYRIQLRRGVAEVQSGQGDGAADLSLDSETLRLFYIGEMPLAEGFAAGRLRGDEDLAREFFAYFEWPGQ